MTAAVKTGKWINNPPRIHSTCSICGENGFSHYDFCPWCGSKMHETNIETGESDSRWVPVTEKLPEQTGHYLVTTEINYYYGGCQEVNKDGTTRSVAVAYYDGTDKVGGKNYWNHAQVIAWKPLPKVYKG